jgi:multicopper oxidase
VGKAISPQRAQSARRKARGNQEINGHAAAETARLDIGGGRMVDAYTYNGTLPGPELRVQQGDLVQVTLINHLPESTTIHWHRLGVPNSEDGVAGVTQDAVKPGASYTYRFVANDVGTADQALHYRRADLSQHPRPQGEPARRYVTTTFPCGAATCPQSSRHFFLQICRIPPLPPL